MGVACSLLSGCQQPPDTRSSSAQTTQADSSSCATSQHATSLAPIEIIGSSPREDSLQIGEPAGLALLDSILFVFDAVDPSVRIFDRNLAFRGRFLRSGRGPGEMTAFRARQSSSIPDFIAVVDEQVLLLDYNLGQVVAFTPAGRMKTVVLRDIAQHLWSPRAHNRMRWIGDTLFFGGGAYFPLIPPGTKTDPVFHVRAVVDNTVNSLTTFPAHPVPRTPAGAFMVGPAEAVPVWDINSRCIVINDGHASVVRVWHRESGTADSVAFRIPPDIEVGYDHDPQVIAKLGMPPFPTPALHKRVSDIMLGPDGIIWIELAPNSARPQSKVVIRVHSASLQQIVDTLPAFPKVFSVDGFWYGLGFLEDETAVVWKGR